MKNVSAPLMTLLTSTSTNELCICDLLTITLNDGTVVCLSNADQDVTWNGQLYSSGKGNITFVRSKTSSKIGVEVAEMDLTLMANTSALTEGLPTLQFVRNSGLDAARATATLAARRTSPLDRDLDAAKLQHHPLPLLDQLLSLPLYLL